MENASKALIIAGAILLSILIISFGIIIIRNNSGIINDANIDDAEVMAYNSKFTQYAGTGKRYSNVNALIDVVNANNAKNANKITITYSADATVSGTTAATDNQYNFTVPSSQTYSITYTTSSSTGKVTAITIDD